MNALAAALLSSSDRRQRRRGEPRTCKDHEILRGDPHKLVEGCLVAGRGMNTNAAQSRGTEGRPAQAQRMRQRLRLRRVGAYICGEETTLKRGSRASRASTRRSPLPSGSSAAPRRSAAAARRHKAVLHQWAHQQPVRRGGGDEHSLRELVEKHCGGVRGGWDNLLSIIPGGCSVPVLPIKKCEDSLKVAQSGLGTGAVIVMDKSTDIIAAIARFSSVGVPFFIINLPQFSKHESCGQCTSCHEGTTWMMNMMNRMVERRGHRCEIDMLLELTKQVERCMICALGDAAAWPM
ncbi:NADH:ubiquinone oxidoreductase 51 kDa subunit [Mycena galericulata]|nr:NADH:ubiquinone oxidoreductase 51 kDa subunit [Mycena galericulata]